MIHICKDSLTFIRNTENQLLITTDCEIMIPNRLAIGILALILVIAVAISGCTSTPSASNSQAAVNPQVTEQPQNHPGQPNGNPNNQNNGANRFNGNMKGMLQNLTAKGYDLTQIQAALDKGDNQTAFQLLNQFYDQHPEARPQMPLDRIKSMVANLTAKGFDTSQIQAAINSGDNTKANTLLNQLYQAHPEVRPTFSADPAQLKTRIDRLKQQGVDVTDIQKAYDSGDLNKTRDLVRQASPQRQPQ